MEYGHFTFNTPAENQPRRFLLFFLRALRFFVVDFHTYPSCAGKGAAYHWPVKIAIRAPVPFRLSAGRTRRRQAPAREVPRTWRPLALESLSSARSLHPRLRRRD